MLSKLKYLSLWTGMNIEIMKKIITLLACFGMMNYILAQAGKISGIVNGSGVPVASATVTIKGLNKTVITDTAGHFHFTDIPLGLHTLNISAVNFNIHTTRVTVSSSMSRVDVLLTESNPTLGEVVISGTMKPISKMASPIPVEVYSPNYFKKNPSPNIFESLQMVNGVQPQLNCNVCNTGDIHINGMEGPYTMILIDGMPIVSSLSTVYGLAGIPNSMVKRIEIVKGPASTLYGSEAVGGLVNIITKDAAGSDKLRVDLSATSVGEYNADVTAKFKLSDKTSSLLGINYFNYQQLKDINKDNFTDVTLQNRVSVFNKWNFSQRNALHSSFALRYVNENRWGGELQWQPKFKGTDSVYGESINTNRVELISTVALSKSITADISYNYHLQDSYYGRIKYYASQQVAFAQLRWSKTMGRHELLMGLPFRYTIYDDNSPATANFHGDNKPSHTWLPGIFIQDQFTVNPKLTSLIGLRYDHNNEHGSILTPRLAFKYSPNTNNTIRLSAGNGFRVVNLFTEDHAALTGAREVVIASALKPEQSWNGNLNYTGYIRHNKGFVGLDASVFYTRFTNKIVADFLTDPNKIIYDNLRGYAVSRGITLNTDFSFTRGLKVIAGVTFMDVFQMDNNTNGSKTKVPQLYAPKVSGTFAISYPITKYALAFDITGKVNGPMKLAVVPNDFRPAESPLYSIINFQVTKTWKSGIECYGGVKNILSFLPKDPLLHPDDPFDKRGGKYFNNNGAARPETNPYGYVFDPSYNYAPVQGAKLFVGIRWFIK
ncbi:MAG TPA: TonB-dependent receptor [Ferruginibacter sp.]|nr:TonB-dependent receptor [Ferruginibacter sp.]